MGDELGDLRTQVVEQALAIDELKQTTAEAEETLLLQKSRDSEAQTDSGRLQQPLPNEGAGGRATVSGVNGFVLDVEKGKEISHDRYLGKKIFRKLTNPNKGNCPKKLFNDAAFQTKKTKMCRVMIDAATEWRTSTATSCRFCEKKGVNKHRGSVLLGVTQSSSVPRVESASAEHRVVSCKLLRDGRQNASA